MQNPSARPSRFPLVFELLIWALYVGLYKYAFYLGEAARLHRPARTDLFPYPQLILFAVVASVYVLPYYRWMLPALLRRRRYGLLVLVSLPYLWWGAKLNILLTALLFAPLAAPPVLTDFYQQYVQLGLGQLFYRSTLNAGLAFTDLLAFSCVGFVRVSFEQEARRRQIEQDHAALQLEQLKAQLQPHFLLNTLNGIYGLSLAGSPDTPRFILLLSELMRYVLYDSGKLYVALREEVAFLESYFELEQRRYPGASIRFVSNGTELAGLQVPPLLLLPLVENSFKHGRHHFSDDTQVTATLTATPENLHFVIENDMLPAPPPNAPRRSGGIGLQNIRHRLALYYPNTHTLHLADQAGRYRAELTVPLRSKDRP
ncbi:sensor histidine kinase [Hymenobacter glacialis]|uniref:Signal transduction histidine kinase internal region domain-containing protein n=1 Tax=Hymenobacter glacialis TaxID=1908236 RepID=A0A1G1T8M3_9BACT|nr:sensor histidine kinase [Hymenobacter glacialis]OGX87221.1 hypothetical protein BEN48_11665 [Hymenobacter glacialis]